MCDCRKDITTKLLERFKTEHPEASGHGVDILNAGINFTTGGAVYYAPVEYRAVYPLKKGGTKLRTTKGSMVFSHCPFCGVRFDMTAKVAGTKFAVGQLEKTR